jgi:hypothetical protein
LSGRRTLIYFDQTQNERGRLDTTYSELGKLLRDNDYDVEPYTEFMLLPKNVAEAQLVVFGCPNSSKVRREEIETLTKYVGQGGSIMLLSLSGGDKGLMNNMSMISEVFGITFENTAVKDDRNNAGLPTMPLIKDMTQHPVTTGVSDILVPSGCSLHVSDKASVIARTSEMADPASKPVIAVAEHGKGRVMCIGSYEVFRRGGGLKHKGNRTFALNAFAWLTRRFLEEESAEEIEKEQTTSKKPKTAERATTQKEALEMEQTLRRLVNAVFDLQKDISKLTNQVDNVEKNIEKLRDQFQDFAEKAQDQFGAMIATKQFKTEDENKAAQLENDLKSLKSELKSVEQLQEHIEKRHSSGAMPAETFEEESLKLEERAENIVKKIMKKESELKKLAGQ